MLSEQVSLDLNKAMGLFTQNDHGATYKVATG